MGGIALDRVSKVFPGDVVAVDAVDLEIGDGEFMVLVGPSGCGKSTLLRMIAGLEGVSAGTIRIGDRDVTEAAPRSRDIAMVFQNYALYPHMRVWDNLAFALKLRRTPKPAMRERVGDVAGVLGLSELIDRKPGALSGGQRQRVLIARALLQDAPLLLLDEPLSGVDGVSAERIEALFAELRAEGRTLLVATHDVRQAAAWDQVLCLHRRQIAYGPPAAVLGAETLRETYGAELIVLEGGDRAVGVGHHAH
jgi:multiple sugar transport system ATP-binding protein